MVKYIARGVSNTTHYLSQQQLLVCIVNFRFGAESFTGRDQTFLFGGRVTTTGMMTKNPKWLFFYFVKGYFPF